MKESTHLFLHGMATIEKLGYKVRTYQEICRNQHDMDFFLSVSEYGFMNFKIRKIFVNMEQPEDEIIKTLYHEIAHILQHNLDESMADEWADLMIERAQRERMVGKYGKTGSGCQETVGRHF